jgi:alanine racemase
MFHTSEIEIDRSALKNNISFLQDLYGEDVGISSVIKGNAYGHGIEDFVQIAEDVGVDHFSVFSADEALRVLKAANHKPTVMIMGMIDNDELEWALRGGVHFYVFELDRLEHALRLAKHIGIKANIHIEVETGMNRTGFEQYELTSVVKLLEEYDGHYILQGMCTHYAGAESIANHVRVKEQHKTFLKMKKWFSQQGVVAEEYHTACSAASIRYPKTLMDRVRVGILQYGFWPSRETFIHYAAQRDLQSDPLKRLISWRSKVMDIKHVKAGEFIGYGTSFLAQQDMKVATVPVGYFHGFSRSLSNRGRVLIKGERINVVGMVNMNALVVDVTLIDGVEKGDEVVLIGKQGDLEISVSAFGEMSVQLNYELLTRLPADIPRNIVN